MAERVDPVSVEAISLDSVDVVREPERSDVSCLGETHTADTAPASLPPPVEDATPSSLPPSDVRPRSIEAAPSETPFVPLDTPGFAEPLARATRLGGLAAPARGPYWEWALLGFCGTLLLVVIALRSVGAPLLSAGLERPTPVVVAAPRQARSPAANAAAPASARPVESPAAAAPALPPSAAPAATPEPPRQRAVRKHERGARAAAAPKPPSTEDPPKPKPARDSVRAGLAQELP
jgi:hypothetical protein